MWQLLVAVAALLAAVLFVPIGVEVSAIKSAEIATPAVRTRLRWLVFTWESGRKTKTLPPRQPSIDRRRNRRRSFDIRAALTSPGLMSRCARLVIDFVRLTRPRRLYVRGRIGFDDPADTGMVVGWLHASPEAPGPERAWHVHVEPDFSGPVIEGRLLLQWSRSIASVAWPVLTFVTSPVVWRAWKRGRHAAR